MAKRTAALQLQATKALQERSEQKSNSDKKFAFGKSSSLLRADNFAAFILLLLLNRANAATKTKSDSCLALLRFFTANIKMSRVAKSALCANAKFFLRFCVALFAGIPKFEVCVSS